jgi:hypothetical protein
MTCPSQNGEIPTADWSRFGSRTRKNRGGPVANRPMSTRGFDRPGAGKRAPKWARRVHGNKLSCCSFPPAFHSRRSIFSFHRFWHRSWMFAPARASSTWREQRSRYNAVTFGLQLSKPLAKLRLISPSPTFPQSEPRRARSAHPGIVNPQSVSPSVIASRLGWGRFRGRVC